LYGLARQRVARSSLSQLCAAWLIRVVEHEEQGFCLAVAELGVVG